MSDNDIFKEAYRLYCESKIELLDSIIEEVKKDEALDSYGYEITKQAFEEMIEFIDNF